MPSNQSFVPTPSEVTTAFKEELHPGQQAALVSWVSFTTTFATVRAITHRIRDESSGPSLPSLGKKKGGLHNISVGGIHLHHYMWGILTVSSVAGFAVRGGDKVRHHPVLAAAYGVGLALIVDEFALLLNLEDDYWAKQGRESVDLAVGIIGGAGTFFVGQPIIRRLRSNRRSS